MAQFDVYKNTNPASRKKVPYLLDVQNDLFASLATRIVVPLVGEKEIKKPLARLNPAFEIEGKLVYMSTAEMSGVSLNVIGKHVCSLSFRRQEIIDAVDFIVIGF